MLDGLVREGAAVMVGDLPAPDDPDVRTLIEAVPAVHYCQADIRRWEDAQTLVGSATTNLGNPDVLINNAALFTNLDRTPVEEIATSEWQAVMDVNVLGAFHMTKAVIPAMKTGGGGKIVNVGSNVVQKGLPHLLHYVASKGAIHAMTRALANELGSAGIRVNTIAPGYVMHPGTRATDHGRNERVKALRALGCTAEPDDLVGTVVFLASADSDLITGQTIVVDGGEVFG